MLTGKLVNKYYLKYIVFYILGALSLILVDYYQLQIPQYVAKIVDKLDNQILDQAFLVNQLLFIALFAGIVMVGRFFWRIFIFGTSRRIGFDLRNEMYAHCENLSNEFYSRNKVGGLMAHYTNDLEAVRRAMGPGFIMFIDVLFLGIMTFYLMLKVNVRITLLAAIPLFFLAVFGGIIGAYLRRKFRERQRAFERMSDFSNENFSGISVIKAFVKEKIEMREFAKINQENKDKTISFVRASTLFNIFITTLISSVFIIVIAYGGHQVQVTESLPPSEQFTIADLVLFIQYFGMLIWPMLAIGMVINTRNQGKASMQRIQDILEAKVDVFDAPDVLPIDTLQGNIEFRDLTFAYPGDENNILEHISFTINEGDMIGIIGRTGSGKTSLVDLLLRIYNIDENKILLDGNDIMKLPIHVVREQIGYVPQDGFLFSDTINNNISLGMNSEEGSLDSIISSAKLSDVHDNIIEFSDGYNTVVGERGVTLSGGQRQRISIARALIKNPPILIMDDSVSAVDTSTEEKILNNLKQVRKGKTTILIAHRISTIKDANKIIVIDNGQIIGTGTHEELIQSCEFYKDMVSRQKLEDEMEVA